MSEAMTVESIIEAEWLLKGYWTKVRYPYQTKKGGWSDIDIIAYDPETKHLVISESKVQGKKRDLFAYFEYTKEEYGGVMDLMPNYFSFINNLEDILERNFIFKDTNKMVKELTIQLVSNCIIEEKLIDESKKQVLKRVRKHKSVPKKCHIKLDTTIDVFARVVKMEAQSEQGRRYGNATLDLARELNRYINPTINYAGQGKLKTEPVRNQAIQKLVGILKN